MNMNRRMGIMRLLLPVGAAVKACADMVGTVDYSVLERALMLPANAKINGVSIGLWLDRDDIAVRVECPDFVETEQGCQLPQVTVMYETYQAPGGKFAARFLRWEGNAVQAPTVKAENIRMAYKRLSGYDVESVTARAAKVASMDPYKAKHGDKSLFVAQWDDEGGNIEEVVSDTPPWSVCYADGTFIGDPSEVSVGMVLSLVAPIMDQAGNKYVGTFPKAIVREVEPAGHQRVKVRWRSCGVYSLAADPTAPVPLSIIHASPWTPDPAALPDRSPRFITDEGPALHEPLCTCPRIALASGGHLPGCLWMEARK